MSNKVYSGKKAAFGGVLGALVIIALYAEALSPVNKLSLYALSSLAVAAVIIETGIKNGWLFYISTAILSFLIIPDKMAILPYAVFFGFYGIIKYYIEKLHSFIPELILKIAFFNLVVFISVTFINEYVIRLVNIKLPWWALLAAFEAVFIAYDYVYTLFAGCYLHKIRNKIGM